MLLFSCKVMDSDCVNKMKNHKILHTERLVLRPLTLEDAPALFAIFSDPETMRFLPFPCHQTVSETHEQLARELAVPDAYEWAICLRGRHEPIGKMNYLGNTVLPGMGYVIHRDYWGQGITVEASQAVLAYGFEELGFDRVELWIDENNLASQRVAQKLNFRLKGRIPLKYEHKTHYHIMLTFGLWAYEWRHETPPAPEAAFFRAQSVLMVHDVQETAVYYRDKLGFRIDFLFGEPPNHAAVSRGDWTGGMVTIQLTQIPPYQEIVASSYQYIFVDTHLDDLCETYRRQGVEIVSKPKNYPWGFREFTIHDLNGHILRFATHA